MAKKVSKQRTPNPATNIIYFKNADDLIKQVYSANGILYKQTENNDISITKYPPGVYIITLLNPRKNTFKHIKLIKL